MRTLKSINPSNYQILDEVAVSTGREVETKVQLAKSGQRAWSAIGLEKRIQILRKVVEEFGARKDEFALLESKEMGMPINEALVDYDGTLDFAKRYLHDAKKYLSPETTFESDTEIHQVHREPIGVAAVIIPWNYPFLNFVWSCFQHLIAGNAVVLKHSEETPLCGKFIEEVMSRHMPPGSFQEVYGDGKVGEALVRQNIDLIHFVGSAKTGKRLYEIAGKKFIKAIMELGGSAPGIIFADADIDAAVASVGDYRLANCGQYCDGLKRLIVHEKVVEKVGWKLAALFSEKTIGLADDKTTTLGPLAAKRQLDRLVRQVEDAKVKGAFFIIGGNSLESKLGGAFFEPTLLTKITPDMKVWKEEVFGPVLPVVSFKTEDEAVALANDTDYGLGGYVYTDNKERQDRVAGRIQTGMVSINGFNYTTPWNPFGGYKNSGIGREHGEYGFHEVTQVKVVAKPK